MKKVSSIPDFLITSFNFKNKTVADIGCGNGALGVELVKAGAKVFGIDKKNIVAKNAVKKSIKFLEGSAENLPLENSSIDFAILSASFHHVPRSKMKKALLEVKRILKKNGLIVFLEPVAKEKTYYELARCYREEKEIQKMAYNQIVNAKILGLNCIEENFYYLIRTFEDFSNYVIFFVKNKTKRESILLNAKKTALKIFKPKNGDINKIKVKSIFRVNVLKRI